MSLIYKRKIRSSHSADAELQVNALRHFKIQNDPTLSLPCQLPFNVPCLIAELSNRF